jgi:hypothetical protein
MKQCAPRDPQRVPKPFTKLRMFSRYVCVLSPDQLDGNRYVCFTICLCISPDLDGNRGTKKMRHCAPRDRGTKNETCIESLKTQLFHDMFVSMYGLSFHDMFVVFPFLIVRTKLENWQEIKLILILIDQRIIRRGSEGLCFSLLLLPRVHARRLQARLPPPSHRPRRPFSEFLPPVGSQRCRSHPWKSSSVRRCCCFEWQLLVGCLQPSLRTQARKAPPLPCPRASRCYHVWRRPDR